MFVQLSEEALPETAGKASKRLSMIAVRALAIKNNNFCFALCSPQAGSKDFILVE